MRQLPSRFRRLAGALADLPLDEPMLLSELDGFLTGIVMSPEPIAPAEWLRNVWGSDEGGVAPFEDPGDVQWFADAVAARHAEIARGLARGKLQPLFDIDERNGDVLWELWADGFAEAMELRPDSWAALSADPDAAAPLSRLSGLVAIALGTSELDSMEINAVQDDAPSDLTDAVLQLHAARIRHGDISSPVAGGGPGGVASIKIGRNDPCSCGSGKKSKRCCG